MKNAFETIGGYCLTCLHAFLQIGMSELFLNQSGQLSCTTYVSKDDEITDVVEMCSLLMLFPSFPLYTLDAIVRNDPSFGEP